MVKASPVTVLLFLACMGMWVSQGLANDMPNASPSSSMQTEKFPFGRFPQQPPHYLRHPWSSHQWPPLPSDFKWPIHGHGHSPLPSSSSSSSSFQTERWPFRPSPPRARPGHWRSNPQLPWHRSGPWRSHPQLPRHRSGPWRSQPQLPRHRSGPWRSHPQLPRHQPGPWRSQPELPGHKVALPPLPSHKFPSPPKSSDDNHIAEFRKCWSSFQKITGCVHDISNFWLTDPHSIGKECCKATTDDDCSTKVFGHVGGKAFKDYCSSQAHGAPPKP